MLSHLIAFLQHQGFPVYRTGSGNFLTRCPAHADENPSLSIRLSDKGKLLLKCFAGCSFHQILSVLESMGFSPDGTVLPEQVAPPVTVDKTLGLDILNSVLRASLLDEPTRRYALQRHLNDRAQQELRLCSSRLLWQRLMASVPIDLLLESGLASRRPGRSVVPCLALKPNRLVIPYLQDGKIVHLSSRSMDNQHPRYASPPGWGSCVYAVGVRPARSVLLVEGEIKAALLYYVGGFPAISIPGVDRAHDEVVTYCLERGLRVVILFDSERNRNVQQAAQRLQQRLSTAGVPVTTLWLPRAGKERVAPDDYLLEVGRDAFIQTLRELAVSSGK